MNDVQSITAIRPLQIVASIMVGSITLSFSLGVAHAEQASTKEVQTEVKSKDESGPVHLLVEANTDFPIFAGGRVELELPGRLRLGTALGVTPGPYLDLTETLVTEVGGVDVTSTNLARAVLQDSFVARGFLAWSPFAKRDLYLQFGYTMLQFSGTLTSAQILEEATGIQLSEPIDGSISLSSTLHGLHGEVGYRLFVKDFTVRLSMGFLGTVASSSSISIDTPVFQQDANDLARDGEILLDSVITQYAFTPTLGLGIGYDFGF